MLDNQSWKSASAQLSAAHAGAQAVRVLSTALLVLYALAIYLTRVNSARPLDLTVAEPGAQLGGGAGVGIVASESTIIRPWSRTHRRRGRRRVVA
jgi:hypothetical protein